MSTPQAATQPPLQILVVEDNPDSRESLGVLLRLWGHEVEVAEDGAAGIEKALAGHPNVALVDIGLPRVDGFQVAERLRNVLGNRVFLIAQTAYSQSEYRQRARRAGFDIYMVKPLDLGELSQRLASLAVAERLQPRPPWD